MEDGSVERNGEDITLSCNSGYVQILGLTVQEFCDFAIGAAVSACMRKFVSALQVLCAENNMATQIRSIWQFHFCSIPSQKNCYNSTSCDDYVVYLYTLKKIV